LLRFDVSPAVVILNQLAYTDAKTKSRRVMNTQNKILESRITLKIRNL